MELIGLRSGNATIVELAFGLTGPIALALFVNGEAISPRGDMPKNRVQFSQRTPHVRNQTPAPVHLAIRAAVVSVDAIR
jgi:hypothetical protein